MDILFFYGGIIGHAQGLEVILHASSRLKDNPNIHFILQGSGPVKQSLINLSKHLNLKNIHFYDTVDKLKMPEILKSIDVSIVPLKNLPLFKGAIPSKVFEAMSMKKPLILGVDGEARKHFIDNAQAGLFFEPENPIHLAQQISILAIDHHKRLKMGENARQYVVSNFNRNQLASQFYNVLKEL